ncbi:MAG: hypothetical protein PHH67_01355 [Methanosarcina sp.]|nr:hypothetical protein [Methanosarcina sp.]MDD3316087.1 hypothetical protein [Methanosarcina sp.]MDD4305153.1 hypothetical protein [Methanosarcina sp.]
MVGFDCGYGDRLNGCFYVGADIFEVYDKGEGEDWRGVLRGNVSACSCVRIIKH